MTQSGYAIPMTNGRGLAPDGRAFGYWRSTRLIAVFVVAFVIIAFCLRVIPEGSGQRPASPDGRVIAYSVLNTTSTAMDADASWIELRTRFTPFRHTVFGGLNYGADVTVSRIDSRNLLIRCAKYNKLDIKGKEAKWHGISIHYEIE
jgi:hypothetical protein